MPFGIRYAPEVSQCKMHELIEGLRAFERLKKAVSATPVLRYYNLKEDVTFQCDASQRGLGAVLLQGGQPVAYASRALTGTEVN